MTSGVAGRARCAQAFPPATTDRWSLGGSRDIVGSDTRSFRIIAASKTRRDRLSTRPLYRLMITGGGGVLPPPADRLSFLLDLGDSMCRINLRSEHATHSSTNIFACRPGDAATCSASASDRGAASAFNVNQMKSLSYCRAAVAVGRRRDD